MLDRAYSLLEIKSIDDDARIIEGIASTPQTDRMGDIVEPLGAQFQLPLKMLWMHGKDPFVGGTPIGHVVGARPQADGIPVRIQMERTDQPGRLKDILDFTWQAIKKRLVDRLSIGFRPTEDPEHIKGTFGMRFNKWEWLELSAVAIPANQDAVMSLIKSLTSSDASHAPGTTGTQTVKTVRKTPMKTIAEQISSFESTRKSKSDEMAALMSTAGEKGETLDAEHAEQYDTLKGEVESLDKHLSRLRDMEEINKASAKPANGNTLDEASASRGGRAPVISIKDNTPPGISLTRVAIAKVVARIDAKTVSEVINERWPDDARVKNYFHQKAAVPAGTTTTAVWAGNLVYADNLESEFVEFLRPQTIVGRIPNLRRVPFNIRFTSQTTGSVAGWVGEGRAKPVTSFQIGTGSLAYTKIAAIAVITQELARFSSPSAELLVRNELARAVIERLDNDFIDPAVAAVANVNPASITNGLTALSSAGTSADNIRTDIQNLLEQFLLNNMNAANVVLIMPNTLALAASLLVNSLGQPEFPGLTMNGGTLMGLPVITSQYAANQSGSGNLLIALDPTAILLADDGNVDVSASDQASVEMSDAPLGAAGVPTASSVSVVSLWQTNSIGIKAERFINWTKARSTAVVYMDDVNWGSIGSPS